MNRITKPTTTSTRGERRSGSCSGPSDVRLPGVRYFEERSPGEGVRAGAGVAALRRARAVAERRVGVPALAARRRARRLRRSRLRRQRLGPAPGAVALAAARLRRARVHERALSVPGRSAVRARREPDGRLPVSRSTCRPTGRRRRGAALRGRRLVLRASGSTASTSGRRAGSRLPAEFDVGELLRPGDENVLAVRVHQWSSGLLPRGPGHVVAVGDLPRRDAARAARRARSTTSSCTPTTTTSRAPGGCGSTCRASTRA